MASFILRSFKNHKIIVLLLISVLTAVFTSILFCYYFGDYDNFIKLLVEYFQETENLELIKQRYYTKKNHSLISLALPSLLGFGTFGLLFFINGIVKVSKNVLSSLICYLSNFIKWVESEWIFGLIWAGVCLYFIFYLPVYVDEASTFNSFSSKSVLISWSFYPAPNNHVLYSILTNVISWLPISDILVLRLPVFICSFFSLYQLNRISEVLLIKNELPIYLSSG